MQWSSGNADKLLSPFQIACEVMTFNVDKRSSYFQDQVRWARLTKKCNMHLYD